MPPSTSVWPTKDWHTSSLEDHGIDPTVLASGLANTETKRQATTSLLIVRHGALVWEEYADEFDRYSRHYIFSVTKSVLSAVVGIVIDQGYIRDVSQPIVELIGSGEPAFHGVGDMAFQDMNDAQLGHLLTMCAGYELKNVWRSQKNLTHPVEVFRNSIPGTTFAYSDQVAHLVSKIVTASSGKTVLELADEFLFKPIGITSHHWPSDAIGLTSGQAGLEWSSRDMARFGYLYLRSGRWEEAQVVPSEWVEASTRKHTEGGPPANHAYGYFWWIAENSDYHIFFAGGFGEQRIFVIPELDLVIVVTVDPGKKGGGHFYLDEVIMPAINQT